ncbi:MAG: glutathione S-transferase N-terminal domain-containing protein [Pseudomonadota bacterium]
MSKIQLHFNPLSGHAHRPWVMLKLLKIDFEEIVLNVSKDEQKSPGFLKFNPLEQIPVLVDGETVLRDSTAALVHLASKYDPKRQWLPINSEAATEVHRWLAISTREVFEGPATARMIKIFGVSRDHEEAIKKTDLLLNSLFETRLADHDWLVGDEPTIADVSNYGYIAAVTEGDVDLSQYPHTSEWIQRLENYPNFEPMPAAAQFIH